MSDLIVKVLTVDEVQPHPDADSLEITVVGGWQIVSRKDIHKVGDEVIHVPPDSLVPWEHAEAWGVANYLSGYEKYKEGKTEEYPAGRVRAIRLRGEISHGFITPNQGFEVDSDVKDVFGITKWEPKENPSWAQGNMEKPNPHFQKYTDIQNVRNFKNALIEGEEIVVTEKIHGSNAGIAIIKTDENERELMIGSRNHRRKLGEDSIYEKPLKLVPKLEEMLNCIFNEKENTVSVICYGEIYGVQDLKYGLKNAEVAFVAFDIAVNGQYLDYEDFVYWTQKYEIPVVPLLFKGAFDEKKVWEMASGKTLIPMESPHIREGVVVKTAKERTDRRLGRVTLKFVSDDYLSRKSGTEYH